MITIPLWLFVLLVFLTAWGLAMLAGPSWFKIELLAAVDAFFLTIVKAIKTTAAAQRSHRFAEVLFGHRAKPKKKRPRRRPKGHPRPRNRKRRRR